MYKSLWVSIAITVIVPDLSPSGGTVGTWYKLVLIFTTTGSHGTNPRTVSTILCRLRKSLINLRACVRLAIRVAGGVLPSATTVTRLSRGPLLVRKLGRGGAYHGLGSLVRV